MKKFFNYLTIVLMALVFAGCPENPNFTNTPDEPNNPDEPSVPSAGFVAKTFSVSDSKQIVFSSGNLQYHPLNNEWRFASNQTNYIGKDNENIALNYDGWIDLFGWGTGTNPTNTSTNLDDYQNFTDWGVNKIGNDKPNTWRTLTYDEWYYILHIRTYARSLQGVAQVDGVNGFILLPDNYWDAPTSVTFKYGYQSDWREEDYASHQTFTKEQWTLLEGTGAVFLPAAGYRTYSGWDDDPNPIYVGSVQAGGGYWSATKESDEDASFLDFDSFSSYVVLSYLYSGHSVRLVQDVK